MNKIKSNKGFTIIEVVLVLAIAGLIFLMVFIALPNLQRSQRDTQRRNDYAALASNITAFISNNQGKLPTIPSGADSLDLDPATYINNEGKSSDTEYYRLIVIPNDKIPTTSLAGKANTAGQSEITGKTWKVNKSDVAGTNTMKATVVYVVEKADCSGSYEDGTAKPKAITTGGDRKFAIYGALETGSYCEAE